MSALPNAKRPPYFSTYQEVDIDIDPEDLEAAGWVYVGEAKGVKTPTAATALDTVRLWHDDNHEGPWRWCRHDLCFALRDVETQP